MSPQIPEKFQKDPKLRQVYMQGYYDGVGRGFEECKMHIWKVFFNEKMPELVQGDQGE
jgi:hypothetical protein